MHGGQLNHNRIVNLHTTSKTSKSSTGTTTDRAKRRSLGTTEIAFKSDTVKASDQAKELRARTWRRQKAMWAITDIKDLAGCHRWRTGNTVNVSLEWGNNSSSSWSGLQNSHSVWGSPVVAVAVSRQRVRDAITAVDNWHAMNPKGTVMLLSLTIPHVSTDSLAGSIDALTAGWAGIIGTSTWKKEREQYGVDHWHKALEITHGINGYHPHYHVLLFGNRELSLTELDAFKTRLFDRYARRLERHGWARPSFEHGIDLVQATDQEQGRMLGAYVAKGIAESWVGAEVAGGAFKEAKGSNRTMWQVLDDVSAGAPGTKEYARDVAIWREYEAETRGVRQTSWSKGAKRALQIDVPTDEEIVTNDLLEDDKSTERYVVATVPARAWAKLCSDVQKRLDAVEYVALAKTAEDAKRRAHVILDTLGIEHVSVCLQVESVGRSWKVATDEAHAVLAA